MSCDPNEDVNPPDEWTPVEELGPEVEGLASELESSPASFDGSEPFSSLGGPTASLASSQASAAYYSAPPSSELSAPAAKSEYGPLAVLGVATVAVGVAVGAWYALAPSPPVPTPIAAMLPESQRVFPVSNVDADLKATEYLKGLLSGKSVEASGEDPLRAANAEALKALTTASPEMAEDIKSGRSVLYRIYLLDFLAQDGDHVELSVNGIGQGDLYLTNAGKEFLIPLAPGVPARMTLTATADGGGGVTVGFVSSLGEARTQTMSVGQSEEWMVTLK
jgi:hypothetical protein